MIPSEEKINSILNPEKFYDILKEYREDLGLSKNSQIVSFALSSGLDKATKIIAISIKDDGKVKEFFANGSSMFSREHGYLAVMAVKNPFADNDLLVTQKICYISDYNFVVYEKIEGQTFLWEIQNSNDLSEEELLSKVRLCGRWLSRLHSLNIKDDFGKYKWQIMAQYLSKYYSEGKEVSSKIEYFNSLTERNPQTFIHGDFQTSNVIIRDRKIWLIDFNDSATGSPMVDVSCFLAQLKVALYRANKSELFLSLEDEFLSAYGLVDKSDKMLKVALGLQYAKILSVICWLDDYSEKRSLFDEVYKYWQENEKI
jgi:thiamine kinase-like enzyme